MTSPNLTVRRVPYCAVHETVHALDIVLTDHCSDQCILSRLDRPSPFGLDGSNPAVIPLQIEAFSTFYRPIKDWQTRIAILQPGSAGEVPAVKLVTADLVHKSGIALREENIRVPYEALSYCWGSEIKDHIIRCNEHPFPVTANLYLALLRLRHETWARYLWVDAICINQADAVERAMQVSNMLLIYKKASEVIVWLGDCSTDDMDMAMKLLTSIPDTNYNNARIHSPVSSGVQRTCTTALQSRGLTDRCHVKHKRLEHGPQTMHMCLDHSQNLLNSLIALFDTSWQHRIWVRQEVWVASNIIVMCGEYRIHDWNRFRAAADLTDQLRHWHPWRWSGGRPAPVLGPRTWEPSALRRASAETLSRLDLVGDIANPQFLEDAVHELDLFNALRSTANCEFTSAHDRIYAILGMTRTMRYTAADARGPHHLLYGPQYLLVDYTLPISELYEQVARYFVQRDESVVILCLASQYGGDMDGVSLPSWVPDWRTLSSTGVYRHWLYSAREISYNSSLKGDCKLTKSGLAIQGSRVGFVSFCWTANRSNEDDLRLRVLVVDPPRPEQTFLLPRPSRLLPASGDIVVLVTGIYGVLAVLRPQDGEEWTFVTVLVREDESRNTRPRDDRDRWQSPWSEEVRGMQKRLRPEKFVLT
ncbi:hypothetical protein LTR86_005238 [Recurvomyces mirabilis]|nr:hypothetical protein LTR86_005238 [Recurvomyces mirabilis]